MQFNVIPRTKTNLVDFFFKKKKKKDFMVFQKTVTDYTSIAASGPRNDSLLRASNQIDTPRLTQRTVKTGISIYRPRRSCNAVYVTTRGYGLPSQCNI